MRTRYVNHYNSAPSKHEQLVKGGMVMVNSYLKRDLGMMQEVIREYAQQSGKAAKL